MESFGSPECAWSQLAGKTKLPKASPEFSDALSAVPVNAVLVNRRCDASRDDSYNLYNQYNPAL
jgi:hypothetical protein